MRFLDANVFIYAYYREGRNLTESEREMKDLSKGIIKDVNEGSEEVMTTVVHISEAVNILKKGMPMEHLTTRIMGTFMKSNVKILGVSREAYLAATQLGRDLTLDPNDALAIDIMRANDLKEIYTFDEHFNHVEGITKLPKLRTGKI